MEAHLHSQLVQPELWVILAAVQLRDEAQAWFVEVENRHIFGSWKAFATAFVDKWDPGHFPRVVTAYQRTRQGDESVDEFYARFKLLRDNLPEKDSESLAKVLFVNALEPSVGSLVLDQHPESVENAYKFSRLVEMLQTKGQKQETMTKEHQPESQATEPQPDRPTRKKTGKNANRYSDVICYLCGKTGHRVRDCDQHPKCYNCQQTGHLPKDCKKKSIYGPHRLRVCHRCQRSGHRAKDCLTNLNTFGLKYVSPAGKAESKDESSDEDSGVEDKLAGLEIEGAESPQTKCFRQLKDGEEKGKEKDETEAEETASVASVDSVEPVDLVDKGPVATVEGVTHTPEDLGFASE
ncbi:Cellular nucleic acid-binding protein [Yarrowia sp. B02]|nr:Cellular nucleic acid-binding protein [Yarrowia sp. B02]